MSKTIKIEVSDTELDDIANGLSLFSSSLKRAFNAEHDPEVKELRGRQIARVLATISRLTNLDLGV